MTVDLTPEVYRAIAAEVDIDPDETIDNPQFRMVVDLAYLAGREDAAKEKVALLDALRRLRDHWYGRPGWTDAAATVDVLIDAFTEGQQPQEEPWRRRAAATGGGPCGTCGKPFWTHVCLSCSPDYQTPGPGCINCRNTGMDQTPCKPARGSGDQ